MADHALGVVDSRALECNGLRGPCRAGRSAFDKHVLKVVARIAEVQVTIYEQPVENHLQIEYC